MTPTTFSAWTIVGGETVFAIDGSGQITVVDSSQLDREAASSFTLQMTVSDGANTSAAETVTINLTDVNDVLPVVTSGQSFTLAENTANGTAVGTVPATDGDVTPTTFRGWTIVGGSRAFAIDADRPDHRRRQRQLDRETTSSFTLHMTVSDGVNTSTAETVTINLTDVNDVMPMVTTGQTFTLAENSDNGTAVGTALATDGDVTPTTFPAGRSWGAGSRRLRSTPPARSRWPTAVSWTGKRPAASRSTLPSPTGANTSAAETVTINLTDVNDVVPVVTAGQAFDLAENSVNGTVVGTVEATDGDVTPTTFRGGPSRVAAACSPSTPPAKSPSSTAPSWTVRRPAASRSR